MTAGNTLSHVLVLQSYSARKAGGDDDHHVGYVGNLVVALAVFLDGGGFR